MNVLSRIFRAFNTAKIKFTTPLRIEFVVTDYCNLNCKSCTHYSAMAPAEYEPFSQLEHDMASIAKAKNFHLLHDVYLIGGETLLYPQLNEAMRLAKKYFPENQMQVFTNGIKLPKMDEDFWQTCRETDAMIALTRYPIKFDYDAAEQLCRDKGVKMRVFGDRGKENEFFRFGLDRSKSQNKWVSHFKCYNFGCVSVVDSKIFPCSISGCISHINKAFGCEFKWEKGDYIEIEKLRDLKEIKRMRLRPVPFCAYCKKNSIIKYGPSKRELSEWVD
jgi:MoaA/NifB/PqqE/SkfB family radical SAM enzyme